MGITKKKVKLAEGGGGSGVLPPQIDADSRKPARLGGRGLSAVTEREDAQLTKKMRNLQRQ